MVMWQKNRTLTAEGMVTWQMSQRIIERKRRVDASLAGSFLVRRATD